MRRQGQLRRFRIALHGQMRPGLFSSERAAVAAFEFEDSELETAIAAKAGMPGGGAIALADLAALRESKTIGTAHG